MWRMRTDKTRPRPGGREALEGLCLFGVEVKAQARLVAQTSERGFQDTTAGQQGLSRGDRLFRLSDREVCGGLGLLGLLPRDISLLPSFRRLRRVRVKRTQYVCHFFLL